MIDRVLDVAIATRIMNWRLGKKFGLLHDPWWRHKTKEPAEDGRAARPDWSPSSLQSDAWQIVEEMGLRGYFVSIQNCHAPKKPWCVIFSDNNPNGKASDGIGEGQGEIGPAICLAALETLKIKIPKNSIYAKTGRKPRIEPRKNRRPLRKY